jgi:hypothetical protein
MAQPSGVDVSRWQGEIDWQAVKDSGIAFASVRATIGDFFTDDRFEENWQGAGDAGIFRCAYHVLAPSIVFKKWRPDLAALHSSTQPTGSGLRTSAISLGSIITTYG